MIQLVLDEAWKRDDILDVQAPKLPPDCRQYDVHFSVERALARSSSLKSSEKP